MFFFAKKNDDSASGHFEAVSVYFGESCNKCHKISVSKEKNMVELLIFIFFLISIPKKKEKDKTYINKQKRYGTNNGK